MADPAVQHVVDGAVARVVLHDPARRNALGTAMFDALEAALETCAAAPEVRIVRLSGAGGFFSAGFDLGAAVDDPPLMGRFIERLSDVIRGIRRLPQVVVAAVEGGAIAGGCAIASACDFVCASAGAKLGYPVLRLGISPAVSAPTLMAATGAGPARAMMLEGRLLTGAEAHRIGLVTHLVDDEDDVAVAADALCRLLEKHGPTALAVTKRWLNELDGSLDDARFHGPAHGTAVMAGEAEAQRLLRAFWSQRKR